MKVKRKGRNTQKFGVVGLVRDGNGHVLVQKRADGKFTAADGKWEFPGGKVDFGESPPDALIREVREETGCEVSVGRLLPVTLSRIWERKGGGRTHVIVLCYECWYISGVPRTEEGATTEIRWCTSAQITRLDCLDGIPVLMDAAGL